MVNMVESYSTWAVFFHCWSIFFVATDLLPILLCRKSIESYWRMKLYFFWQWCNAAPFALVRVPHALCLSATSACHGRLWHSATWIPGKSSTWPVWWQWDVPLSLVTHQCLRQYILQACHSLTWNFMLWERKLSSLQRVLLITSGWLSFLLMALMQLQHQ